MTLTLRIGSRLTVTVRNYADASKTYAAERDASGEGCSTFPEGALTLDGQPVARVSYNGRVWPPETGKRMLYDPRTAAGAL